MSKIIEVENLIKYFDDVKAVDDISFSVKQGSLFAFLGLNGAGKSTTINILCSILKKDSGTVTINGLDLDKDSWKIKESIGIVFQNSVLDNLLTVKQNLYARASLYKMSKAKIKERIEHLCEIFNLKEFLNRKFGVLSGGQKRRVDIARALMHEPTLLFLDEPTTGLDPTTRVLVWKILDDLRKKLNLTIFLTTHYMEESARADKVVILDSGKIVAKSTPDQLKNTYAKDYVRVISKNENEEIERKWKQKSRKFKYSNNSYYVEVEDSIDALNFLNDFKEDVTDFEVIKGDMDDVFLNVTGKNLEG